MDDSGQYWMGIAAQLQERLVTLQKESAEFREEMLKVAREADARNAELEHLLMNVVLAVGDPREMVKGNSPSFGQAVITVTDGYLRGQTAEAELAKLQEGK